MTTALAHWQPEVAASELRRHGWQQCRFTGQWHHEPLAASPSGHRVYLLFSLADAVGAELRGAARPQPYRITNLSLSLTPFGRTFAWRAWSLKQPRRRPRRWWRRVRIVSLLNKHAHRVV
jgi:hypothetical protein